MKPRVVFEDPGLPHQIVITLRAGFKIAVSCNCLRVNRQGARRTYEPIEVRYEFPASEAIAVWRAHMAEVERQETAAPE
jgi:hypothetical protein